MRYGCLLAETNPDRLLAQFQMNTIEEVFLNLCEREDIDDIDENSITTKNKENSNNKRRSNKANKKRNKNNSYNDINKNKKIVSKNNNNNNNNNTAKVTFAKYDGNINARNFYWFRVWAMVLDAATYMNGKFWTLLAACILPTIQIFLFHFSVGKPIHTLPISVNAPEVRPSRFSDILIESLQERNVQVVSFFFVH